MSVLRCFWSLEGDGVYDGKQVIEQLNGSIQSMSTSAHYLNPALKCDQWAQPFQTHCATRFENHFSLNAHFKSELKHKDTDYNLIQTTRT